MTTIGSFSPEAPRLRRRRTPRDPVSAPLHPRAIVLCALTAAVMILGGGGSTAPRSEVLVELCAIAAFVAAVLLGRGPGEAMRPDPSVPVAARILLLLPLAQLVPLPATIWHHLPGRAGEIAALRLVGEDGSWRPLSLSPARTVASLLSLVPPLIAYALAATLDRRGRTAAIAVVASIGLASLVLGALQLADGPGRTWRFYVDNPGYLNGFQANRNAQVDVLLIAAIAVVAAATGLRRRFGTRPAAIGAIVAGGLLLLGCVLTGSRAGIAMIPLAMLLAMVAWRGWHARSVGAGIILITLLLVAVPPLVAHNHALAQVADRFADLHDFRGELWTDTRTAISAYWPAGSGIGTFRPVFIAAERLAVVDPTRPVRAHNDYLEFLLEGGAAAAVVMLTTLCAIVVLIWHAVRRARADDVAAITFCSGVLAIIALHSAVDYPLRSMALAQLGALGAGMLRSIGRQQDVRMTAASRVIGGPAKS